MTPKAYFEHVFELDRQVESKRNERQAIRDTVLGSTTWEDNPTYSNQFHSTTESAAMKLLEHNDRVNEQIDELVDYKIQLANELDQLEVHNHRMVLRERYLCSKRWEEIAVEQSYDLRWIHRLHGRALDEFGKKFPDKFSRPC